MFPAVSKDVQVLGISVDSIWSHSAFARHHHIPYPLLSDFQPRGAVAERYGVLLGSLGVAGRTAFLIDKTGRVKLIVNADIPDERKIDEILREAALA